MKKIMSALLAVTMLFALSCPTYAIGVDGWNSGKEDRIDEIFGELNELANEVNMSSIANSITYDVFPSEERHDVSLSEERLSYIRDRKADLDNQLESLGVHKIDPDCKEDLEHLGEVMLHAIDASSLNYGPYAAAIEDPPNLEVLSRKYSLYQYDDSIYTDKIYKCSYIVVVDDKGYNGLTTAEQSTVLCGEKSIKLSDLANYNFSFGFSQFLGSIPYGWAIDWAIGSVFTALKSYNSSSIVTRTNKDIYTTVIGSTTQMTYYYIYDTGYSSWVLCGSRASKLTLSRSDLFAGNVGGEFISLSEDFPASSSTGESAKWYFLQYAENNRQSNHHSPGSFTVNGMNGSKKFTPVYYSSPSSLQ